MVEAGATPGPADDRASNDAAAWRLALLVLLAAAGIRALLSWLVPLLPDETYYWEWTRRPDASYYDHPPGIAALVTFGTSLLGDTRAGVRVGPALAHPDLNARVELACRAVPVVGPAGGQRRCDHNKNSNSLHG